jgi:catechol 2,3-dioxygenase-like lactoylglutathione lyase family enzyme
MAEIGFTHVSLPVTDLDRSVDFYCRFAGMTVIDRLRDPVTGNEAARLSDGTRPFALALIKTGRPVDVPVTFPAHLGVGCPSKDDVNRLAGEAKVDGSLFKEPVDAGFPLGYWALLTDPDGHHLELSYGQNDRAAT